MGEELALTGARNEALPVSDIVQEIKNEQSEFKEECETEKDVCKDYLFDMTSDASAPVYLFSIGGVPTVPHKELIGIKGLAKSGKSQFIYFLVGTILGRVADSPIQLLKDSYKVLLFDTEQSSESLFLCCKRAFEYAGIENNMNHYKTFMPYSLRILPYDKRLGIIRQAVEKERPDIVFIDGIRDLVLDINQLKECYEVVQEQLSMAETFSCTVITLLHRNKAMEDTNMRGHLGTELMNKLSDCFEVQRRKETSVFDVTCAVSRNEAFPPFAFSINSEGKYQNEEADKKLRVRMKIDELKKFFHPFFQKKETLSYKELMSCIKMEVKYSEVTVKRRIREAKENGILLCQEGRYSYIAS